jgi:hypothetical protein
VKSQDPTYILVWPCSFGLLATSQHYFFLKTIKPTISNHPIVPSSQNKLAPGTSNQPNERLKDGDQDTLLFERKKNKGLQIAARIHQTKNKNEKGEDTKGRTKLQKAKIEKHQVEPPCSDLAWQPHHLCIHCA